MPRTMEERKKAQEEAGKLREAAQEKLRAAIDSVLRTEDGRTLFKFLFEVCGYNKSSLVANRQTGELSASSTAYNEARRAVYIVLRNKATRQLLTPVEEAAELEQLASTVEKTDGQEKK